MTTPSPIARTIKCLLAALLAHACMVSAYENPAEGFSFNPTPSATQNGGGSWWFGGSATPAAAPVSSSGGSGGWLPSWFSGAGSSSSTQSSSSGQSSFSPSATQLAIGAAGAAAASLTTYYLYNLYQKFNKQYEAAEKYYRPMLDASSEKDTLDRIKEKQGLDTADLGQFSQKLDEDIKSLSPLNWAEVRAPLYAKIVTPTKVSLLKGELVNLLRYVDSLLKAKLSNPAVTSSSTSAPAAVQVVQTAAAAQPKAPGKKEAYQLYNELLDEQQAPNKRTIPWSDYGQEVKGAIEHAQQYGSFDRLLNIINKHLDVVDKSHAAFALFIDNLKMDTVTRSNPLITLVQTKPNILNQMPDKLSKQLQEKLTTLKIAIPPAPKQAASTVENPDSAKQPFYQKPAYQGRPSIENVTSDSMTAWFKTGHGG